MNEGLSYWYHMVIQSLKWGITSISFLSNHLNSPFHAGILYKWSLFAIGTILYNQNAWLLLELLNIWSKWTIGFWLHNYILSMASKSFSMKSWYFESLWAGRWFSSHFHGGLKLSTHVTHYGRSFLTGWALFHSMCKLVFRNSCSTPLIKDWNGSPMACMYKGMNFELEF